MRRATASPPSIRGSRPPARRPSSIDPREGDAPAARRALVASEVAGLQDLLKGCLIPLEEGECRRAMAGDLALISKPGRLLARYERDAWRYYRESMAAVDHPVPTPVPTPVPPTPSRRVEVPVTGAGGASEGGRRDLRAGVASFLEEAARAGFLAVEEESDWMVANERHLDDLDGCEVPGDGTNPISRPEPALA